MLLQRQWTDLLAGLFAVDDEHFISCSRTTQAKRAGNDRYGCLLEPDHGSISTADYETLTQIAYAWAFLAEAVPLYT